MSPVTVCVTPSMTARLIVLFCLFWPFVALAIMRRHERSPTPFLAMLLPFAVSMSGVWIGLHRVILGMALSGGGSASTAAGIAEALGISYAGAFSAALIAIFALVRRHRPALDHFTIVVALSIVTEILAAMLFTAFVAPAERQMTLTLIWAATALVIALVIAGRMILVVRRVTA